MKTSKSKTRQTMVRRDVARLEDIPNIGPSLANDLRCIGLKTPDSLSGKNPYLLYDQLCLKTKQRHDPCVIDAFISAVRFMEGGPPTPWWKFTAERKRHFAKMSRV